MRTQKHFKAIAKVIADYRPGHRSEWHLAIHATLELVSSDLADYFASQNERFDREKFFAACRGE